MGLGERSAGPTATCCRAFYRQAVRYSRASPSHASAAPTEVFRERPENRRIREVQFMLPEFVIESAAAGGGRLSLPDKLRWGSGGAQSEAGPPPAEAAAPPHDFQKNSGNPQTLAAPIYGGQWSSPEPAAARGCRHCRPAKITRIRFTDGRECDITTPYTERMR